MREYCPLALYCRSLSVLRAQITCSEGITFCTRRPGKFTGPCQHSFDAENVHQTLIEFRVCQCAVARGQAPPSDDGRLGDGRLGDVRRMTSPVGVRSARIESQIGLACALSAKTNPNAWFRLCVAACCMRMWRGFNFHAGRFVNVRYALFKLAQSHINIFDYAFEARTFRTVRWAVCRRHKRNRKFHRARMSFHGMEYGVLCSSLRRPQHISAAAGEPFECGIRLMLDTISMGSCWWKNVGIELL